MIVAKELDDIDLLTEFFKDPYVEKYQGVTEKICPPYEGFYYLGVYVNGELVCVAVCYNLTAVLMECHVCTKKSAVGFGDQIFKAGLKYIFDNFILPI